MRLVASTAFGLEAIVARELDALGVARDSTTDGRVVFNGNERDLIRANLHLRCAERVQVLVGRFPARDFDELFEQTKSLAWEEWLPADAAFPVSGSCVRSQLSSEPACQRSVKKAIVERLRSAHGVTLLPETGSRFPIEIAIRNDEAWLLLDSTGRGLHKRGYRTLATDAPLRETLAAAMVQLSFWNNERLLVDPFCGSGTILIEAVLIALNRAPGIARAFVSENWPRLPGATWREVREAARNAETACDVSIQGFDTDPKALNFARQNARSAGVDELIHFQQRPFSEFQSPRDFGVVVSNPPYGERLGDLQAAEELAREIGNFMRRFETWSFGFLSALDHFQTLCERRADRRRKLYNGPLKCTYFQFNGPRPPAKAK